MLPYLSTYAPFPPTHQALDEPNGLLAAGGDLSPQRLIQAYSQGIFPWYSDGEPIMWWSPDPRTVFFVEQFKLHKSALKTLKKQALSVTINQAFDRVIDECARPRRQSILSNPSTAQSSVVSEPNITDDDADHSATWITAEMKSAYRQLHQQGVAHSVEVWQQKELVGGIYGINSGATFCGESMFSRISNGSKIALSCLIFYLKQYQFQLIDCQVENPHLIQLGAINISRKLYLDLLTANQHWQPTQNIWQPQSINWQCLFNVRAN